MLNKKAIATIVGMAGITFVVSIIVGSATSLPLMLAVQSSMVVLLLASLVAGLFRRLQVTLFDLHAKLDDKIEQRSAHIVGNVQAAHFLTNLIDSQLPLPPMGWWAANADTLAHLAVTIMHTKPNLVVELGSGVSTVISAYALQKNGFGRVVSIDHDAEFARSTKSQLERHGLLEWAEVRIAPLEPLKLDGVTYMWYDQRALTLSCPIDLLFVDGPPQVGDVPCRFPAFPILGGKLAHRAVILVDDGARKTVREMVEKWVNARKDIDLAYHFFQNGFYELTLNKNS